MVTSSRKEKVRETYGCRFITIVPGGQNETGLGLVHAGPCQVGVFQTGSLDVDDPLGPHRYLQNHPHRRVQLYGRQ